MDSAQIQGTKAIVQKVKPNHENTPENTGVFSSLRMETKKMLASKIKRTYFDGANNSTPFFALVMPSGVTRSIVLLKGSFKRTSPVYDKTGKQIESQSRQNWWMDDFAASAILRYRGNKTRSYACPKVFSDRFF